MILLSGFCNSPKWGEYIATPPSGSCSPTGSQESKSQSLEPIGRFSLNRYLLFLPETWHKLKLSWFSLNWKKRLIGMQTDWREHTFAPWAL